MEGVSKIMPLAIKGAGLVDKLTAGSGGASDAAEARAQAVEAEARRRAEETERAAREKAGDVREAAQHKEASARVAAANSGLTLSGSPLLSLEALEHESQEQVDDLFGDAAVRAQGILDSGAAQAQSIRLSGRSNRSTGLGTLLSLGGRALEPDKSSIFKD
jgi:hypothetical protein